MRVVVDTNVVVYFLLGTVPLLQEARRFWRSAADVMAPAVWEAELANVVWMAIRKGIVPLEDGPRQLDLAGGLGIRSVPVRTLWHGGLSCAVEPGLAVYDALFVELARRENLPLATFDTKILNAFPNIAKRPRALIASLRSSAPVVEMNQAG
jgi:predicted nucleic acid-binding protein